MSILQAYTGRNAGLSGLVTRQSNRPVFLCSLTLSTSAALVNFPAWTAETVGAASQTVLYKPGDLIVLSSTVDCNVRVVPPGSAAASGTVTYSGSSGAQTITLGGRQVSFTAGANDTATAQNAVAALVQDPQISLAFNISYAAGVVTMKRLVKGTGGNTTLVVTGTGATRSGANLTGGTDQAAAAAAGTSIIVPAKLPFPIYTLDNDWGVDAIAGGAGTLNVLLGL